jgi:hypothetical protein
MLLLLDEKRNKVVGGVRHRREEGGFHLLSLGKNGKQGP